MAVGITGKITSKEIEKLKRAVSTVGVREVCYSIGWKSPDNYYNIIYGKSKNRDNYTAILHKAAELMTQSDDHAE